MHMLAVVCRKSRGPRRTRRGAPADTPAGAAEGLCPGARLGNGCVRRSRPVLRPAKMGEATRSSALPVQCKFGPGGKRREQGCDQSVRRRFGKTAGFERGQALRIAGRRSSPRMPVADAGCGCRQMEKAPRRGERRALRRLHDDAATRENTHAAARPPTPRRGATLRMAGL